MIADEQIAKEIAREEELAAIIAPIEKHRWFWSSYRQAEEFYGPFATVGAAIDDAIKSLQEWGEDIYSFYACQGRRTTKDEREGFGLDIKWQCGDGGEIRFEMTPLYPQWKERPSPAKHCTSNAPIPKTKDLQR